MSFRNGLLLLLTVLAVHTAAQPAPTPRPAAPLEPITAVLDAFKTHQ